MLAWGRCANVNICNDSRLTFFFFIMMPFKSLVVVDLETSGLPSYGKVKITELSFVGVLVQHVLDCHKTNSTLPRVLQKLNLCFYPQKRIDFESSEITGLDNFLLEEIPSFNNGACVMLSSFLQRLPPPICLVAHNGMKFDFPLLKAEVAAKQEVLLEDLFCADSLTAFRAIFPIGYGSLPSSIFSHPPVNNPTLHFETSVPSPVSPGATSSFRTLTQSDSLSETVSSTVSVNSNNTSRIFSDYPSVSDMQKANETTPKQSKRPLYPPPLRKRSLHFNNENCEDDNGSIRKKLFRRREKLKSHKLVDLYRYIQGREQDDGHQAENDSLALLECIVSTAPEFLEWIQKNHLDFQKVPCMW